MGSGTGLGTGRVGGGSNGGVGSGRPGSGGSGSRGGSLMSAVCAVVDGRGILLSANNARAVGRTHGGRVLARGRGRGGQRVLPAAPPSGAGLRVDGSTPRHC